MPWFHVLGIYGQIQSNLIPHMIEITYTVYRGLHLASIDLCLNYSSFWLEHADKLFNFSKLAVGVDGGWRMREKIGVLLCQLSIVVVIPPPLPVPPRVHREVQRQQLVLRVGQWDDSWKGGTKIQDFDVTFKTRLQPVSKQIEANSGPSF